MVADHDVSTESVAVVEGVRRSSHPFEVGDDDGAVIHSILRRDGERAHLPAHPRRETADG